MPTIRAMLLAPVLVAAVSACNVDVTAELATVDYEIDPWRDPDVEPDPITGDVVLDIDSVGAHHATDGWFDLATDVGEVNMDQLIREGGSWFDQSELPEGRYDQLRLVLNDAWVITEDGSEVPLEIPSGDTSGLKIHTEFCLEPDTEVFVKLALAIRVELDERDGSYWLRPSLQLEDAPPCDA